MRVLLLIAIMCCFFGCTKKRQEFVKKLDGINGPATYIFNSNGELSFVVKDSFNVPNKWAVFIHKDTLKLGQSFQGYANYLTDSSFTLIVVEPTKDTLTQSGDLRFDYIANKTGIYNFSGALHVKNDVIPFTYKFIVVE